MPLSEASGRHSDSVRRCLERVLLSDHKINSILFELSTERAARWLYVF